MKSKTTTRTVDRRNPPVAISDGRARERGQTDAGKRVLLRLELLDRVVQVVSSEETIVRRAGAAFGCPVAAELPGEPPDLVVSLGPALGKRRRSTVVTEPADVLAGLSSLTPARSCTLVRALTQWAVESSTSHYIFHAGSVARDGRGILLPARSWGGKSTLTAALVRRGFGLFSDEVGALDVATGRLVPFRRRLSIRKYVFPLLGLPLDAGEPVGSGPERWVDVRDLGGAPARSPVPCRLILMPNYRIGTSTRAGRLRPAEAVVRLMKTSCSQRRFKVQGLDLVIDLARRVPTYVLTFSNLEEAVAEAQHIFDRTAGEGRGS